MRSQKHLLAALILICSTIFLTTSITQFPTTPVTIVVRADSSVNQSLTEVMPNEKLQTLVLYNMKEQGLVSNDFTLTDFTADTFKDKLAQLTTLVWDPETQAHRNDQTYKSLDTTGPNSNGTIEPGVNPADYSLKGLEYATDLKTLKLAGNISYGTRFYQGDITDVTPLEHLTNLENINLSENRITDISPIADLPNVRSLDVSGNCIANLNTLDASHYKDHLYWTDQKVFLPLLKITGNSYTWKDVFKDSLPKNATPTVPFAPYSSKYLMLANAANGFPIPGSQPYKQLEVWLNGTKGSDAPAGTQKITGDDYTFTGLANQIEPNNVTTNPWGINATIIHGPYTYYMIALYGTSNFPALEYLQPYDIVPAIKYTIHPVDENGQSLNKDVSGEGQAGDKVSVPTISGYTVSDSKVVDGKVAIPENGGTITVTYKKNATPVTPTPTNPDTPNVTPDVKPVTPPSPTPVNPLTPSTPDNNNVALPDYAAKKGAAVYGINHLYLYKKANFTKGQRIARYVKKPRIYRPMFVVTDFARSTSGKLRYKVRDVNHHSKSAGKTGYITASWQYVRPVYYATKHSQITVISPKGVNAYKTEALTGKVKNYKQGTVLRVKGIVKHNLTTRYILTNGKYVTANRKLVNMGPHKMVTKVRAKITINRYKDVNLRKRNQTFKKGKVFKVHNYDYSRGYNLHQHGTLRYHVAGGYITGNSKYVTVDR